MKSISRRDFGKGLGIGVTALSLMSPSLAKAALSSPISNTPFVDFSFGDLQKTEMVCLKRLFRQAQTKYNFSGYKMPVDISFFGEVEIGTPRYDYYKNRLLRITFSILEKGDKFTTDLNSAISLLDQQSGLTLVKNTRRVQSAKREIWADRYVTDQGHVIEIDRRKRKGSWMEAWVKIYDKILMDEFNMGVNPNFIPK